MEAGSQVQEPPLLEQVMLRVATAATPHVDLGTSSVPCAGGTPTLARHGTLLLGTYAHLNSLTLFLFFLLPPVKSTTPVAQ
jgi:hypothetical protein